ncbi:16S rRNA (cytosine(1402)-N(4))-methyltransferase RsmH [Bacteroidia bacterium]|nr:16S rRNA (cytosine(1402)-N(4))-methyltransferase RsmH [Bacteroidia bacterium]MDB9882218.1 16S rRNA (cytosine(1402)-N(4))-methyltransferase RsmH [Bacteroidia bacterium]MDC1395628.1 16S rRNA (cytosine(1402)-N(4))-methyltransferase RsmH [Bacteroidia bacterium]
MGEVMSSYHVPVMLQECLDGLSIDPKGTYVDVTYGGGGHSRAILDLLDEDGTLLVFDQDADAAKNRIDDPRLHFCEANFKYLANFCSYYGVSQIDGLLADLGVSSHHLNEKGRGFSFRFGEAELDMRMNTDAEVTAKNVLNTYEQPRLAKVLRSYGELDKASPMANAIVSYRAVKPIQTTEDLEEAVGKFLNDKTKNKTLAKIYQAVRIEVNAEMSALEEMLSQATDLLKPAGRLVVMSYHSLEDRIVKNLIQTGNTSGDRVTDHFGNMAKVYNAVSRKPIMASSEEIVANPRARSAKLRIAEKL